MHRKTILDISYYTFPLKSSKKVINSCYSTLGFLNKVGPSYKIVFIARTIKHFKCEKANNVLIKFFKSRKLKKWQVPFRFHNYIKSFKPDFILVHGFGVVHYLVFLRLIIPNVKIVLQCNGHTHKPKWVKKNIYRLSDRFIDGYLFTGKENAKHWYESKSIRKEKVFQVMEGSTSFKINDKMKRKPFSFIWVGGLNYNKDPLTVLKAFNMFLTMQPLAKLTMVFHENDLLDTINMFIINKPNLIDAIDLRGYVEHGLLEDIYNQNKFFILGSHYEGSGYALSEAMACGCVPVITNIPSFKYMTNNGECAFLFSPANERELFEQLIATQTCDYNLFQSKVTNQFKNKLSFEAIAKEIVDIFQSL
ncbi:hypothetical protein BFR04_00645 [Gaetbulibacter sp. 4G1]|nr:glycosyltransferase family 4 protein [Gaetbulibacter sp. 4G1]PIA79394.1 hypothetical protein BFR04_00645 [Gaetbulibacter sp. 4G1]